MAVRHGGRDLGVFSKAMTKECEISFWSDEHVLNWPLTVAHLCDYTKIHQITHFKSLPWAVCELYLNKAVKNHLHIFFFPCQLVVFAFTIFHWNGYLFSDTWCSPKKEHLKSALCLSYNTQSEAEEGKPTSDRLDLPPSLLLPWSVTQISAGAPIPVFRVSFIGLP